MKKMGAEARAVYGLFPSGRGNSLHWLYAFGLRDGRIKIGMTSHPRERLAGHLRNHRGEICWTHLFRPLDRWLKAAEDRALLLASKRGRRQGHTEWFTDLSKDDAIRCGRAGIDYQSNFPISAKLPSEMMSRLTLANKSST